MRSRTDCASDRWPWSRARSTTRCSIGCSIDLRSSTGNIVIDRKGGLRRIMRALNANQAVAVLIDQHILTADAVKVDFLGRPAATTSAVAVLAMRTGAAVIPAFSLPLNDGRYRLIYEPPLALPTEETPDAVRDLTQRCTKVLEKYVRAHPERWLWMHRRWRDDVRTTESPSLAVDDTAGRRRGVSAPRRVVVRGPNWLGDLVMAAPAIRGHRRCLARAPASTSPCQRRSRRSWRCSTRARPPCRSRARRAWRACVATRTQLAPATTTSRCCSPTRSARRWRCGGPVYPSAGAIVVMAAACC